MQSQDQVRRRVMEHFAPMRLEVEGELYSRQLAVAHELEALEAKAMAIRGGTLCEEVRWSVTCHSMFLPIFYTYITSA